MNLYVTADKVGIQTGGGVVTYNESEALKEFGGEKNLIICQSDLSTNDPFAYDDDFANGIAEVDWYSGKWNDGRELGIKLAQLYSGTLSNTVFMLHDRFATKVSYTAAAHSIEESRKEHEYLGIPYIYNHLTDPGLWERYVRGYLEADILICPSTHSARTMQSFGARQDKIRIIPHGCTLPDVSPPVSSEFRLGYLGAYGPDKGVRYLLEAWKKLNYSDATLVLAGRDSTSPFVKKLIEVFGGGKIELKGWVDNISNFYNYISVYVQPSVTEGFGIEVLEAMAHGRVVICSIGAGAVDCVSSGITGFHFKPRDVDGLASIIDLCKNSYSICEVLGGQGRDIAKQYTWDKIRTRYQTVWKELVNG